MRIRSAVPDGRRAAHAWRHAAWLALALAACDDDPRAGPDVEADAAVEDDAGDPGDAARPAPDAVARELEWTLCGGREEGECTRVEVPLFWDRPDDGRRLTLRLHRQRADAPARGHLWLLAGGPGGTSASFEQVGYFREIAPDLDIYLLDHRGAGRSTRLGCPDAEDPASPGGTAIVESEWPACAADLRARWGDALEGFSTTQAAWDLGRLVQTTAAPGEPVYVYGVSYGTFWAHRYLQVFPRQPAAVALDSVCPPGACSVALYDAGFDEVARHLLRACAADAPCAARLGSDPVRRAEDLYRRLEQGHCPRLSGAGFDAPVLRRVLAALLTSWELRALVPAVIYRYDRCDAGDIAALEHLLAMFRGGGDAIAEPLFSPVLNRHIGFSEMWGHPAPDPADVQAWEADLLAATGASAASARLLPRWPVYAPDRLALRPARTDAPLLLMNGTLDPQTPLSVAERADEWFVSPDLRFVALPGAAHGVVRQAPTRAGTPCGLTLLAAFLRRPDGPLDLACVDDLLPVAFDLGAGYADYLLGVPDVWENPRGAPDRAAPPTAPPPDWDRVRRRFHQGNPDAPPLIRSTGTRDTEAIP